MKKIAICIPHSYLSFNKKFTLSLLGVVSSFHMWNERTSRKYELNVLVQSQGWIDTMREHLVLSAKKWEADYLLWLDTDMTFPPDMIARMLAHFDEIETLEAVTGLYTWKKPPFLPHVYTHLLENGKFSVAGGFPLKEPFKVAAAGYGCLMIKAHCYPDAIRPWFEMKVENDEIVYGEDLYYFKKVNPISMICDPTISCGHLTENSFDINAYLQYNKLKVHEGDIVLSGEQLKAISDEHTSNVKRLQE